MVVQQRSRSSEGCQISRARTRHVILSDRDGPPRRSARRAQSVIKALFLSIVLVPTFLGSELGRSRRRKSAVLYLLGSMLVYDIFYMLLLYSPPRPVDLARAPLPARAPCSSSRGRPSGPWKIDRVLDGGLGEAPCRCWDRSSSPCPGFTSPRGGSWSSPWPRSASSGPGPSEASRAHGRGDPHQPGGRGQHPPVGFVARGSAFQAYFQLRRVRDLDGGGRAADLGGPYPGRPQVPRPDRPRRGARAGACWLCTSTSCDVRGGQFYPFPSYMTTHDDSLLWVATLLMILSWALARRSMKTWS